MHSRVVMEVMVAVESRGFTLIELVVVILLVAILSIYALPRFFSSADIEPLDYRERLVGLLRLAQLQAMEQGPCHKVLFSGRQFGIPRQNYASTSCDAALPGAGQSYAAPHFGLRYGIHLKQIKSLFRKRVFRFVALLLQGAAFS